VQLAAHEKEYRVFDRGAPALRKAGTSSRLISVRVENLHPTRPAGGNILGMIVQEGARLVRGTDERTGGRDTEPAHSNEMGFSARNEDLS